MQTKRIDLCKQYKLDANLFRPGACAISIAKSSWLFIDNNLHVEGSLFVGLQPVFIRVYITQVDVMQMRPTVAKLSATKFAKLRVYHVNYE